MIILRGFKTELDLNGAQKTACARHAGAARFAYNWGLARKIAAHRAGEKVPTAIQLARELTALKRTELSWLYAVSKCAPQEALRNLDQAFVHFFRRVRLKQRGQWRGAVGFPRFKSKKSGHNRFRLTGSIHVYEQAIKLPRLGRLRLTERDYLPTTGARILSATVSERVGRWYISVLVEIEIADPEPAQESIIGVDLGVKALATTSEGLVIPNPKALQQRLRKVKRLQRAVSRKTTGSANYRKACLKLARLHQHVANVRRNALHQATTRLAKTKSAVVIEDLNVSGLRGNHKLARAISDVGLREFRRQLIYKGTWYGCRVIIADRFFPSSKRCSGCGHIRKQLALGERQFKCEVCGFSCDRDLNAARNLEQWPGTTASSAESHACGEEKFMAVPLNGQVLFSETGTGHHLDSVPDG